MEIRYTTTADDIKQLGKFNYRRAHKVMDIVIWTPVLLSVAIFLFGILTSPHVSLVGLIGLMTMDRSSVYLMMITILLFAVVTITGSYAFNKALNRSKYRETTLRVSEAGVDYEGAQRRVHTHWSAITDIVDDTRMFYFLSGHTVLHFVPKRAFADDAHAEAFCAASCRHRDTGLPATNEVGLAASDAVSITYAPAISDVRRAQWHPLSKYIAAAICILGAVWLASIGFVVFTAHSNWLLPVLLAPFAIVASVLLSRYLVSSNEKSQLGLRTLKLRRETVDLATSRGVTTVPWNTVTEVYAAGGTVYIMRGRAIFCFVPLSAFDSPEAADAFVATARRLTASSGSTDAFTPLSSEAETTWPPPPMAGS